MEYEIVHALRKRLDNMGLVDRAKLVRNTMDSERGISLIGGVSFA